MPSSPHASRTPSRSGARSSREYWFCTETKAGPSPAAALASSQLRDGEVRAADLAHLARVDEFAQRAQRVGDRHGVVGVVQLVEVDVIGAETSQRVLAGAAHVGRARAEVRVVDRHAELGRDDRPRRGGPERHAEHHLGLGARRRCRRCRRSVTPASSAACTTFVVPAWSRREPKLLHPTPTTDTCSDPSARVSMCSPLRVDFECRQSLSP